MALGVGFRGASRPGIVNVWPVEIPLFSRKREVVARVEQQFTLGLDIGRKLIEGVEGHGGGTQLS